MNNNYFVIHKTPDVEPGVVYMPYRMAESTPIVGNFDGLQDDELIAQGELNGTPYTKPTLLAQYTGFSSDDLVEEYTKMINKRIHEHINATPKFNMKWQMPYHKMK
jgi:hypothetical protein